MNVQIQDPVFAEMAAATERALWDGLPELSGREKALLCLVADICQQTLGTPFERHVRLAYDNGLSPDDLRELLRFISYDSGYPAAASALDRLTALERDLGVSPTGAGHEVNAHGTGSPLPPAMLQSVRDLDEGFADYMALQSRMRAGMQMLDVRERAFATMTVDVLFQTLEESFSAHIGRALGAGATPNQLRAVIRFSALFGMTKAWRALIVLNNLLNNLAPNPTPDPQPAGASGE
ncbi:carboxymuconolactone decarboxylase family protein [Actinomadura logoneensis]|uniref:Carboxymuconolactone decarboxylase family protein n=1 Tax=Actinomadura logoneensis TaxID=2293572 RepID=A0A372JMP5_9ACTN|nr:carboxymuconolactone decarboxylase family protein [Actinomadura logoneensis]RFU41219.1 carboxymuconolactone decarboxylase family protein [Actinomadura logoneensis]